MEQQAATPTGGAEDSARPAAAQPSTHDRLKAAIFAKPEAAEAKPEQQDGGIAPKAEAAQAEPEVKTEAPPQQVDDAPKTDAGEEAEAEFSTLSELSEGLGWDLDKLLDLSASTKIDGKEGSVRLRDLIKSHQLEGHLNQKLMTHAENVKAHELALQNFAQERAHKIQQMDAAHQVATRLLEGQYANVKWAELTPEEYKAARTDYEYRQQALSYLADQIGAERQAQEDKAAKDRQAFKDEQQALLESKVPEWSDKAKRSKDIAEMASVLEQAYGVTKDELLSEVDHRLILIAKDAWQWRKLQQSKPATLAKLKTAPKLLKPGTQQSRASQDNFIAQKERERLKTTGKQRDAKAPLKRLLLANNSGLPEQGQ